MVFEKKKAFIFHDRPAAIEELCAELKSRGYDLRQLDTPGDSEILKEISEHSLVFIRESLAATEPAVHLQTRCRQNRIPFFIISGKSDRTANNLPHSGAARILLPMDYDLFFERLDEEFEFRKLSFENTRLSEENDKTRSFFQNLLNGTSEAILMVNLDFEIQYCNRAAEKLIGISQKLLLYHNLHHFIKDGYKVLNHIYHQLMLSKKVGGYRVSILPENGTEIDVNLNADFIQNSDGNIEGLVLAMENTSFQSDLFNRLLRKEKLITIQQLAGALAHEIRNPINILSGRVQLLKNELSASHFDKSFGIIERQVDRISALASQLLKFNDRREDSIPQIFPLCRFVSSFCENHRHKFENLDIKLDLRQGKEPNILIEADQYRLEDALNYFFEVLNRNLPAKTGMRITCTEAKSYSSHPVVEIQFILSGRHDVEPILEPFRLQTQEDQHSSFGVAIMHTIFSNYEAGLCVDASKGNQTRIRLQFPVHNFEPETEIRPKTSPGRKQPKRRKAHN